MTEFIINYSGVYYKLLQCLLEIQKVPQNPFNLSSRFSPDGTGWHKSYLYAMPR